MRNIQSLVWIIVSGHQIDDTHNNYVYILSGRYADAHQIYRRIRYSIDISNHLRRKWG